MPDDRPANNEKSYGVVDRFVETARDVRHLLADHLELAMLEAQRAAGGLVRVLVVTIVAAILLVGAWLAAVSAGAIWATQAGLSVTAAFFVAAAANVLIAGLLFLWLHKHVPEMLFAATLRQVRKTMGSEGERNEQGAGSQPGS
jgi:TRAP-type C4-dicarboxylate transport system permease small subunit